MGPVARRIAAALSTAFDPVSLDVVDESHLHAGHVGARPDGETHFRVTVVSDAFRGRPRLERHRMVHAVLEDELRGPVHALAIVARAPD
ncbi:BolA family protein [Acuticoccus sp.]|uniref:BolA family protein n=1 Tax=Acuticoccus sp. TaxID=1904378 RepID=UPI003B5169B8